MSTLTSSEQALTQFLAAARRTVFLTGAGMSTESGIPDFRSARGLYAQHLGEEIFDIRNFDRTPSLFYNYGRRLIDSAWNARPNSGHRAIAALEHKHNKDVAVITQNMDVLHQKVGSSKIYPIHGTIETCSCRECGEIASGKQIWRRVKNGDIPPRHRGCGGIFKPDIVFFGEELPLAAIKASETAVAQAELLVVAGTSLVVYPAAMLPRMRPSGCRLVIINRTPTDLDDDADLVIHAATGATLSNAIAGLDPPDAAD